MTSLEQRLRERSSFDRDLRDADRVNALLTMVSRWLDELRVSSDRIEHPDIRWQPDDLEELLIHQLCEIIAAAIVVTRGPVVVEP